MIDFDTILILSGPNLTPKASLWGKGCPSTYKGYLGHISNRCMTQQIPSPNNLEIKLKSFSTT